LTFSNDSKNFDKILFSYVWDKGTSAHDKFLVPKPHGSASSNFNRLINNKSTGSLSNLNKSKNIKTHDEFANALKNREKSDFVKYMNFGVDRLEYILFSEQQYNDLIRFCISEQY
ncbi:hypothetical protein BpHYR1_024160, partial [Brachionus plicatilis]